MSSTLAPAAWLWLSARVGEAHGVAASEIRLGCEEWKIPQESNREAGVQKPQRLGGVLLSVLPRSPGGDGAGWSLGPRGSCCPLP